MCGPKPTTMIDQSLEPPGAGGPLTMETILHTYGGREWTAMLRAALRQDLMAWEPTAGFPAGPSYFRLRHEQVTGYVTVSRQTPMWQHECQGACEYLGRFSTFDLYYHRMLVNGRPVSERVLARYGDAPGEVLEEGVMRGHSEVAHDPQGALHVARSRRWDQDDPMELLEDYGVGDYPVVTDEGGDEGSEADGVEVLAGQLRDACAFHGRRMQIENGGVTDDPWVVREVLGDGGTRRLGQGPTMGAALQEALRAVGG